MVIGWWWDIDGSSSAQWPSLGQRQDVMGQRQDVGRNNDTVESINKVVSLSRDAYCQCLGSGNSTLAIKLLV